MSRSSSLVFVLLAACGGAETPAETASPPPKTADAHAVCVQSFQRQRECTDEFIPALVDARVRLDAPPGIADKDQELGRDQLVSMALEEWETDSTDASIEQACTAMTGNLTPEQQQGVADQVGACLDADSCGAFVDCTIPIVEPMLR